MLINEYKNKHFVEKILKFYIDMIKDLCVYIVYIINSSELMMFVLCAYAQRYIEGTCKVIDLKDDKTRRLKTLLFLFYYISNYINMNLPYTYTSTSLHSY